MKLFRYSLLLVLVVLSLHSYSQSGPGQIKGIVYNPDREAAVYSTVVLMNKDSVFMSGALTGEDGSFHFDKLGTGDYHVMVRNVEFNTFISELITLGSNEVVELEPVQLEARINDLEEVVIRGEKAMVEVHSDKMVFNVSASVNSTGNNALELLGKSPGVRVDMDNNIILQGKSGVQIYINGRPSRISGSDLANMLEGMRSENIESIEIITNPSAEYDAEGTGGIINIVLKKNMSAGFNGNLNASYSKGIEPRTSAGTNLNYSGPKLNLFGSINFSDDNYTFNRNEIMLREEFSLDMISLRPTNRKGINFSGGMDYKINNEHTLSLDARALVSDRTSPQSSNTLIEDVDGILPSERLIASTLDEGGSSNYSANLHYSFVPNRSSEFSADFSLGRFAGNRATDQPNEYYSIDSTLLRSIQSQYNAVTGIDLLSTQVDYKKSLGKTRISAGMKYSYIQTNNQLEFYDIENEIPVLNEGRTNDFTYREQVTAGYIILGLNPTDKISMNAGLRVENTSSLGELISANPGPDDIVPRNYTSFFPNFSIAYNDQENHALSLSYGRRITRPDYQNLNPFESKLSELAAWRGNPFLEPNYISNYQISYSFKRKLVISNTYSITRNYFANIFLVVGDKGNIITPRNMDRAVVNGLSVSYPLKVTKWWEFSAYMIYNYESYSGDIEGTVIELDANVLDFRMQNDLRLPMDLRMEVSTYYTSPSVWRGTTIIDRYYSIDLGLKREFLNRKLMLQISARDIFNTGSLYLYSSDYGGMLIDGDAFFDGRRILVNATYKFGNQKLGTRKSKSAMDAELNRISD